MTCKQELIDELRNSLAKNKLFVITGAGVSTKIRKKNGSSLPSWGELIQNIKARAEKEKIVFTDKDLDLLSRLIPEDFINEVHGDSYIEASQIIENRVEDKKKFSNWIKEETTGEDDYFGEYHRYIEKIKPRGIVTFNYDLGHENAYKTAGTPYESVLYYENDKLRSHLNNGFEGKTLILKAHGCISEEDSIVLTRSSYSKLLNDHRTYRAIIQHTLSRFTVLIVGFSLRDRDFDQMLNTIDKDFGSSVQNHIAIMKQDEKTNLIDKEKARKLSNSNYAVLESRYGLKVLSTESHRETEEILKNLSSTPGSWIKNLAKDIVSNDKVIRGNSRKEIQRMSDLGKRQLCDLLLELINSRNSNIVERSEQLYSLGLLKMKEPQILELFISECENHAESALHTDNKDGHIECIAHSLVALRSFFIEKKEHLESAGERLVGKKLIEKLAVLDDELRVQNKNPRLVNYARAAFSEIVARSETV